MDVGLAAQGGERVRGEADHLHGLLELERSRPDPDFALAGHPLWVANWHVAAPLVPAGDWAGYSWSVWQWASDGEVDGITGNVDLDWLRGGFGPLSVGGVTGGGTEPG